MAINNDNNNIANDNANVNDNANGPSKDQLLALYKHAFITIKQQLDELKQAVEYKNDIIKFKQDLLDEANAKYDETKELLSQMIKKDEIKTAMLKQLMKK